MSAPVTSTTPAPALDVNGVNNPANIQQRRLTADLNGDQLSSSNVANAGNTKLFDAANKKMGKQDFLQLLVTQLKYQDPLSPEANTEFVAQLAQFSNLEGTQNINKSIDDLGTKLESMVSGQANSSSSISNASATSLIGKQVRVTASDIVFDPTASQTIELNVHTDPGSKSVLSVLDDKENVVNAITINTPGESKVNWNGMKANGGTAAAGKYHLKVTSEDGATDTGYTYLEDKVTGINYAKEGLRLEVRGQSIAMDQVVHVGEAPTP